MAALEIVVVGVIGFGLGALAVYFLSKKTKLIDKIAKKDKRKEEVLNDPELLIKKLNENGKIVDTGETLEYGIVEEGGKKTVGLTRTVHKAKPTKQAAPEKGKGVASKKGKKAGGKKGAAKKG